MMYNEDAINELHRLLEIAERNNPISQEMVFELLEDEANKTELTILCRQHSNHRAYQEISLPYIISQGNYLLVWLTNIVGETEKIVFVGRKPLAVMLVPGITSSIQLHNISCMIIENNLHLSIRYTEIETKQMHFEMNMDLNEPTNLVINAAVCTPKSQTEFTQLEKYAYR